MILLHSLYVTMRPSMFGIGFEWIAVVIDLCWIRPEC